LYAGALVQLTMGHIGSCLCILTSPVIVGGNGLRFMSDRLWSGGMSVGHLLIVVRSDLWNLLVGSLGRMLKLLSDIN
jgi:hypothetical protein